MINWHIKPQNEKYARWYQNLIQKAKNRNLPKTVYTEGHHIIPRSFGGSDDKNNIVKLTAREHYIAHIILWKMNFSGEYNSKMAHAACFMMWCLDNGGERKYKVNSRLYESLRKEYSLIMSERVKGDKNPAKTPESRKKNSESHKKLRALHKLNGTGYYSKEFKAIQQEAQGGANNGRANEYIFTDKNNIEYSVKGKINEFCKLNVIRMDWVWNVLKNKTNDKFNGWSVRLVNDRGTRNSIYKDNEQKFVFDDEVDIYLHNGWQLGSKPRKVKKLTTEQIKESVDKRKATLQAQREQGIFTSLKGKKRDPESVRKGADKIRGKPSPLKGSKMNLTDEQRKNRSEKQKARPKLFGADNHNYGKKWSAEAKQKMSEYKRNNTSNETRAKISASRKAAIAEGKIISWNKGTKGLTKGNPKIWEVTDPLGTVYIVTNGLKNFCKNHPISYDSLKEVSTGKKEHVKGWKAKEIIDNNSK